MTLQIVYGDCTSVTVQCRGDRVIVVYLAARNIIILYYCILNCLVVIITRRPYLFYHYQQNRGSFCYIIDVLSKKKKRKEKVLQYYSHCRRQLRLCRYRSYFIFQLLYHKIFFATHIPDHSCPVTTQYVVVVKRRTRKPRLPPTGHF